MITAFAKIGQEKLKKMTKKNRKEEFLKAVTIVPNEFIEGVYDEKYKDRFREIIINLDTVKDEIEIKLGEELIRENQYSFFGFELPSRNGSKLFFTTNNWNYHLNTVPHLIWYIKNKNIDIEKNDFMNELKTLSYKFYDNSEQGNKNRPNSYLLIEKFKVNQREKLEKYYNDYIETNKKATKKQAMGKLVEKAIETFIISDILKVTKKDYNKKLKSKLNIFSLKINDKYIVDTKFKEVYIDIIYFAIKDRFFVKKELKNTYCDICQKKVDESGKNLRVTGKVDLPTKFYNLNQKSFFENLEIKKSSHKAFSMCEECYENVRVGISEIEKNYSGKLFNRIDYYLIPKNNTGKLDIKRIMKIIKDKLSGINNTTEDYIQTIKDLKKREIKSENLILDFLFWYKHQAEFIVIDNVVDISYNRIKYIFFELEKINNKELYSYLKRKTSINDIYYLLFSQEGDSKIYRKELISLFISILNERNINYNYLINKFNFNFRKKYYKNENKEKRDLIIEDVLKMNILLSWINQITNLKGGLNIMEGKSLIQIDNKDIIEFFEVHSDIYEKNHYKQGLFLLGVLINNIKRKQEKKKANILDKINFDGIPVKRVPKFVLDITEYLKIYKIFDENYKINFQMLDRLQGIESSKMNKDEVVFYILSGIGFGRYLVNKYSYLKKENNLQEGK